MDDADEERATANEADEDNNSGSVPLLPDDEESQHDVVIHVPEETARTAEIGIVSILILIILAASAVAIIVFVLDRRRQKKIQECVEKLEKTEEGKTQDPPKETPPKPPSDQNLTDSATPSEVDEPPASDLTTTTPSITDNVNNSRDRNANAALNRQQRRCCMCLCCPSKGEPSLEEIWKQKKQQQKNENARKFYGSRNARQSLKLMEKGMRHMESFQNFLKQPRPSASTTKLARPSNRHHRHRSDNHRQGYGERVVPADTGQRMNRRASHAGDMNRSCWIQAHQATRTRSKSRDLDRLYRRQQHHHHREGRVARSLSMDVRGMRSRSLERRNESERQCERTRHRRSRSQSQSRESHHHRRQHRHHPEQPRHSKGQGRDQAPDAVDSRRGSRHDNYNVNVRRDRSRDRRSREEAREVKDSRSCATTGRPGNNCRTSSTALARESADQYSDETSSQCDKDSVNRINTGPRQHSDDNASPFRTNTHYDLSRHWQSRHYPQPAGMGSYENRNHSANRLPQQFRHSTPDHSSPSVEVHLPPPLPPPPPPPSRTIPNIYHRYAGRGRDEAGQRQHPAMYPSRYSHLNVSQNYNCEDIDLVSSFQSTTSSPAQWMTRNRPATAAEDAENRVSDEGSGTMTTVSERATLLHPEQRGNNAKKLFRLRGKTSGYKSPQFLHNRVIDSRQPRCNDDNDETTTDDSSHGKAETVSLAAKLFGLKLVSRKRLHKNRPFVSRKKRRRAESRPILGGSLGSSSSSDSEDTTYEASKGTEPVDSSGSVLSATLPVDSGYDVSGSFPSESQQPSTALSVRETPRQGVPYFSASGLVETCLSVRRRRKNGGTNGRDLSPIQPACDFQAKSSVTSSLGFCTGRERRSVSAELMTRDADLSQGRCQGGDSLSTKLTDAYSLTEGRASLKPVHLRALDRDDGDKQFRMLAIQRWCEQQRRPVSNPVRFSDVALSASPQTVRDETSSSPSPHTTKDGTTDPSPDSSSDIADAGDDQGNDSWQLGRVSCEDRPHRRASSIIGDEATPSLKEGRDKPCPEPGHRDNVNSWRTSACGATRCGRGSLEELAMLYVAQGKELPPGEEATVSEVDFMDFQSPPEFSVELRRNEESGCAQHGESVPQQHTVSDAVVPPSCSSDLFEVLTEERVRQCHEEKKVDSLCENRSDGNMETRADHSPVSSPPIQRGIYFRNLPNASISIVTDAVPEADIVVTDNQTEGRERARQYHEEKKMDPLCENRCYRNIVETRADHIPVFSPPIQWDNDLRNLPNTATSIVTDAFPESDTVVTDNQTEVTVSTEFQSVSQQHDPADLSLCGEDKSPKKCVSPVKTSRTIDGTSPRADKHSSYLSPSVLPLCAFQKKS